MYEFIGIATEPFALGLRYGAAVPCAGYDLDLCTYDSHVIVFVVFVCTVCSAFNRRETRPRSR